MDLDPAASKERLLHEYVSSIDQIEAHERPNRRRWWSHYRLNILLIVLFAALITTNAFLLHQNASLKQNQQAGISKYSKSRSISLLTTPPPLTPLTGGVAYDVPNVYQSHTDWWGENETLADELWEGIDVSPLTVALTDEWASEHGLERSESRFPWDDSKGLYYLKAFHGLHCLKLMRRAWVDNERGNPPIVNPQHVYHCLDALRQDITCTADDTPMPTIKKPHLIGNGQVRMCRNMDKIIEWTQAPERQACYRRLTDYTRVAHKLERFAFCPKDSEYFPVVEAYFDKWGHKDPFVD